MSLTAVSFNISHVLSIQKLVNFYGGHITYIRSLNSTVHSTHHCHLYLTQDRLYKSPNPTTSQLNVEFKDSI